MKQKEKILLSRGRIPTRVLLALQLFAFVVLAVSSIAAVSVPNKIGWLSVSGNKIVDESGAEMRLRGYQIDFGSMCGDLGDLALTQEIIAFCDAMLGTIVTEADFVEAEQMGANVVRLSLTTFLDFESAPYQYREPNFKKLDAVIGWAEKHRVYLLLSMRQSPGGHNTSPHSGNNGRNELWGNAEYQNRIAALWKTIAARYADQSIIMGYDLLNEPVAPDRGTFTAVMERIISAIREVDTRHIVVVEGNQWGTNLSFTGTLTDQRIALSIHFYVPGSYAVDGTGTYPSEEGIIGGQPFKKETLRLILANRLKTDVTGRPVVVGEFGAMTRAGNYLAYDSDLIDLFEEQNIGWIYWHQKNIKGKSDTQAFYYAAPDNAFLTLAIEVVKRTLSNEEIWQATEALKTSYFIVKQDIKDMLIRAITTTPTIVEDEGENIPQEFLLYQNYPNPFNPTTTIRFTIPKRERVTLKVFDTLGREVATLVNGELNAGEHSVVLDAKNLSSGVYFYRLVVSGVNPLTTSKFSQTKMMGIVK